MSDRRKKAKRRLAEQWLVLEPNGIEKQYWKDLQRYRELFAILAWALIRPFLTQPKASAQQQVYFPRLIVLAVAVITSFLDFLISFVILAGLNVCRVGEG